jgi:pyruvate dehydrogenase E1 component
VNRYYVAQAAVAALAAEGKLTAKHVSKAIELYGIDGLKLNPLHA